MTPYYSDDLVTIYHGDMTTLRVLGDVIVTDPPYGTGYYAADTDVLSPSLLQGWVASYASVAVFGWPENLVRLCVQAGLSPREWLVWWPTNAALKGRAISGVPRETEHIAVFGEVHAVHGMPRKDRISDPYAPGPNARGRQHVSALGKRWGDVWTDPAPGLAFQWKSRLHPNEKPVPLMRRLIQTVADGVVLDPFAGSGSTLVAAKSLGRQSIGIEINEAHCEIAAQRCSQEVLGLTA